MRKVTWYRVKAPTSWRPKINEELVGEYIGFSIRTGQFGEYKIYMIKSSAQIFYVSGTTVNDLFALLETGTKVKIIYLGKQKTREGDRQYKVFELYTEEEIKIKLTLVG